MSKFYCLCMSPAIDATVTLKDAPCGKGAIFKDVVDVENVGGKTINVARWLALRGAEVACSGLLGEDNAVLFGKELAKFGVQDRFVRVPGSTRRNEMVVWPDGSFKINRAAFAGVPADFFADISRFLPDGDLSGTVAILSGSLPKNCPKSFYAGAICSLKAKCAFVVFDASGEALKLGLEAQPDVIKPNADECEALVGFVPKTPDEFRRATELLKAKVGCPIISDGGSGCWFDGAFVAAPKVDVTDTTAAGDTLLAEWCWQRLGLGRKNREAARWAVAAGSAACLMPGGDPPAPEQVKKLWEEVK